MNVEGTSGEGSDRSKAGHAAIFCDLEEGACEYLAEKMFRPGAKGLVCSVLAGKGEMS